MLVSAYVHKSDYPHIYIVLPRGHNLPERLSINIKEPKKSVTATPGDWEHDGDYILQRGRNDLAVDVEKALADINRSGYHIGARIVKITEL